MARPIWTGHISFGLVNIPVTLHSAEKSFDLHFNLLDSRDHARIRYERVNEVTGEEVPWNQVVKAYDYDHEGNYVLLTEEDFKKAAVEATQTVEIEDFVDLKAIDPLYFDKPYYLLPAKKGEKGYVLLRQILKKTNMAGIAKVVIRTRQYLAAVIPLGDALVLNVLRFKQEIKAPKELELPAGDPKQYKISPKELQMAEKLVDSMSASWKPERYHDDYRNALLAWIEKKAKSGGIAPVAATEEEQPADKSADVIDIMKLLQKSVERRRKTPEKKTAAKSRAVAARPHRAHRRAKRTA